MTPPLRDDMLVPPLAKERIGSLWDGVQRRRSRRRCHRQRWAVAGVLALLVLAATLPWITVGWGSASPWEEAVLETRGSSQVLTLGDRSHVELAPHSKLRACGATPPDVCIELERGSVKLDVAPRSRGRFEVQADAVRVRVVGTRFSVERFHGPSGAGVAVAVDEGTVEVRVGAGPSQLVESGQVWSVSLKNRPTQEPPVAHQATSARASGSPTETREAARRVPSPSPPTKPSTRPSANVDAENLWERATGARREGRHRAAEAAYEALLKLPGGGPRRGYVLFDLGRLRMDALGDPAGAISPLQQAVGLGRGTSFHADALARLAQAAARSGNQLLCARSRDQYLAAYPEGAHRAVLERACGK